MLKKRIQTFIREPAPPEGFSAKYLQARQPLGPIDKRIPQKFGRAPLSQLPQHLYNKRMTIIQMVIPRTQYLRVEIQIGLRSSMGTHMKDQPVALTIRVVASGLSKVLHRAQFGLSLLV